MTIHEIICSDEFVDLAVENSREINEIEATSDDIYSFHDLGGGYRLYHIRKNKLKLFLEQLGDKLKYDFPLPMGFMEETGFEHSGIENIHQQPYMQIRGAGTLIGIIDTGIDYLHPAFINPDNTTKIMRIWDQTIEGIPPEGLFLGHEYIAEDINRALENEDPYSVVAHKDTNGHGTFLAGIAAGNDSGKFKGVAPDAELIIVKIKPAKQNFKDYWLLKKENIEVFIHTDIILAMWYVAKVASQLGKPISINFSVGTNHGPHDNSGLSGNTMEDLSHRRGVAIVGAAGNEGISRHHTSGFLLKNDMSYDIELKSGENEKGFCLEIWIPAPDIMSVVIKSPLNEYVEMLPKKFISSETSKLLFENTSITIEYQLSHFKNGDQVILVKFDNPTPGIWTITLRWHLHLSGKFNAWLPHKHWVESDTVFINPDPSCTVTTPGAFTNIITVGAYNHRDESLYIYSGRGPSRIGNVRPDLVAPGVNIAAPWINGEYQSLSGTSVASSIVAGCAALLLEWGVVRGNDPSMNTYKVRNYLIGSARREKNISYPNNIWGYGKLDLTEAFNIMKL